MFENFKLVSLSYKKTSIELRERVSLDENSAKKFITTLKDFFNFSDILIVSTCNRTEIYYNSEESHSEEIIKLLAIQKEIDDNKSLLNSFEQINSHKDAVKHLFRVSMGLESQVVGDIQISNQIKHSYQWSADLNAAGPFLHRLMHSIFYTNKRVVQETEFHDGAASTSYAAVELVQELTYSISNPKVVVVGLGEIGADVCKNLSETEIKNIKIANRTASKAEELAQICGFETIPFNHLKDPCQEADVIISSLRLDEPFFNLEKLTELNVLTHKFFIDLSVPRSVDPKVEEIPGILVYNIDHLQNRANEALQKRLQSIPKVESIVDESINEFENWTKEMEVSPVIKKLKSTLEEIRQQEIARHVKKLNEEQMKLIDDVSKNIMQKIIKLPVLHLKAACKRGEAETLIDVLNDLFDLEKQEIKE